jgi:hypothetical protein
MSNEAIKGRRARPTYFLVGVLTGAAAVGAYTISCDSMSPAVSGTGTTSASQVAYGNGRSGLKSTTVQDALDEIGTTMRVATAGAGVVTGGSGPSPTIWTIQTSILDPNAGTMTSSGMGSVTFTETAPGQGTYETTAANVFMLDGLYGAATGTRTGKYFLVGDWLLMTGQLGSVNSGLTWLARLSDAGQTITLNNAGAVVLVLSKQ